MKNRIIKPKLNIKNSSEKKSLKFKLLISLFFVLILGFAVSGSVLMGLGYSTFSMYLKFHSYYLSIASSLNGFEEALKTYNQNAITNSWVQADLTFFVIGIVMFFLLLVSVALFFFFKARNKKRKENITNL